MVGIAGRLEVSDVAGVALRRHRLELAAGGSLVAGIAIYGRMRARQREAVVMLLHLLYRDLPSANRVAPFAVRSQLPLMNVGVAVLAALSNAGEHWLDVALRAGNGRVHSAQGIFRLVVIEFWDGADRLPPVCRVAVLARNVQISVRTMSSFRDLRPGPRRKCGQQKETDRD